MKTFFFKCKTKIKKPNILKLLGLILFLSIIFCSFKKNRLLTSLKKSNRPFVTLAYQGELGNKLFQTAAAISYALENNYRLIIPKRYLSSKSTRKIFHQLPFEECPDSSHTFLEEDAYIYKPIPKIENVTLKGFFISEKYFSKHKDFIQTLFSPPKSLKWSLEKKYPKILKHPCKVAFHIRTYYKDYLNTGDDFYNFYPAPDIDYYQKAINEFPENAIFIVCSDNISWCKKHLSHIPRKFYFIEGQKCLEDFYLLTLCDHMITSNSTFSWWAAYLIANPNKKVIARVPWILHEKHSTEDVIPSSWIQLSGQNHPPIPIFD